jgi:hypothetical protein
VNVLQCLMGLGSLLEAVVLAPGAAWKAMGMGGRTGLAVEALSRPAGWSFERQDLAFAWR